MKKMLTKTDIRRIVEMWDTKSKAELADILGVKPSTISNLAGRLRRAGLELTRKRQNGTIEHLIKEVVSEYKAVR